MNEQLGNDITTYLSKLKEEELMAVTLGAFIRKSKTPIDQIMNVASLLSAMADVVNEAGRITIIDELRNAADRLEEPIIRARIEKSCD